MNLVIPNVIFRKDGREILLDIYSRLLPSGIIYIQGTVTCSMASIFLASITYITQDIGLNHIFININSGGGEVYSGLALLDIMSSCKNIILETRAYGLVASAATLPMAGGTPGYRFMTKHARAMIHQASGSISGRSTTADIGVYAGELDYLTKKISFIYQEHSSNNTSAETFYELMKKDTYMTLENMQTIGLADKYADSSLNS